MYDIFLVVAIAFWREEEEDDLKLSSVHNQPSQNLLPKMFRFAAPKIVSFFLSTTYVPFHIFPFFLLAKLAQTLERPLSPTSSAPRSASRSQSHLHEKVGQNHLAL